MTLVFSENRSLSEFSTFAIGGPILHFAEVRNLEEMREGIFFAKEKKLPFLILGKGSNCLFDDLGFLGVVLLNKIDFCIWNGSLVSVGAGFSFSLLGAHSAKQGFAGLEFASGIPATVGGAVFMNAGANGKETADTLVSVQYLDAEGKLHEYRKEALRFSYRFSSFQQMQGAIISASFQLQEEKTAREKQLQIIAKRKASQPLQEKSIGCVFRNPSNASAGQLIDASGLKGFAVGGAKVSEIHANFIVNHQKASAQNVRDVIARVQAKVLEKTGILLEPEIRMIPHDVSIPR